MKSIYRFPEILKELRKTHFLSQKQLGQAVGYSQAAIARWEANLQVPNIDVVITLAKYFDVSTDYLLGLIDKK